MLQPACKPSKHGISQLHHKRRNPLRLNGTPACRAREPAPIDPERRAQIDRFVADKANAESRFLGVSYDSDGGEIISRALTSDSHLGKLTPAEQSHMAEAAVKAWQGSQNRENVTEAAAGVRGNPGAARALGRCAGPTRR